MAQAVKWQIPFVSLLGTQYRIDIYEDGYTGTPIQLLGGPTPFETDEDVNDDFFTPVRSQTGNIQVCTEIPVQDNYPDGGQLDLRDILSASNIDHPVCVMNITTESVHPVWQGFLSCETYSQSYTSVPEILTIPVNSVLEAMRSVEINSSLFQQESGEEIGDFIDDILAQILAQTGLTVDPYFSTACENILEKYIFVSQFFSYETNEASGEITYLYKGEYIYNILEKICKYMGWILREDGDMFYFTRLGSGEFSLTSVNMSDLEWRGTNHTRTIFQGAKRVAVEADVVPFDTYFEMPICPINGLTQKNYYGGVIATPTWCYDKCTQASVLNFTSQDTSKAFLARFYGIRNDSSFPWNTLYESIGFDNSVYLTGKKYTDTSYIKLCTVRSALEFSCILGVQNTIEDAGSFVLKLREEVGAKNNVESGYMRCGLKFAGRYYSGIPGTLWNLNANSSFKVTMSNGTGELRIPLPKVGNVYTFEKSDIELYLYDDFDNGITSAIVTDIEISYDPPFKKYETPQQKNRYLQNVSDFRNDVTVQVGLASSFANVNSLSHIYEVVTYTYSTESVDYLEPIKTIPYLLADNSTESRRPELDLLTRMAAYYNEPRQIVELEVVHPSAAALPLIKLNGLGDGKVYLPLSESRNWYTGVSTIKCFETTN